MVCDRSFEEVKTKPVKWLWKPFIAYENVNLIQGDTGTGKTNLLLKILCDLSRGIYPPTLYRGNLLPAEERKPLLSYYVTSENSIELAISAMIDVMHGFRPMMRWQDEKKGHFYLTKDDVCETSARVGAQVLVVDPWQSFLPKGVNTSDNAAMRTVITEIQAVAEELGMAIILAGNYNKNDVDEIRRGMGASEVFNTLRSVISIMPTKDPTAREIRSVKMSYMGKETTPVIVRQNDDFDLVYEDHEDDEELSEEDNLKPAETAITFLHEVLTSGPMDSNEVLRLAKSRGISERTLYRVKARADVRSIRAEGNKSLWAWDRPCTMNSDSPS